MLKNINKKRLVLELILLIILYILSYPFIHSKNDVNNIDNIDIENNTEVIVITNDTDEVTQPTKPTLTPETTLPKESEVISETLEEIKESEKKELEYKSYSIPKNKGFKSYMGYKTLTNKSSWQYKLQQSPVFAYDCCNLLCFTRTDRTGYRIYKYFELLYIGCIDAYKEK